MANILLLNGPNLNMLGTREPERYGHTTLETVHNQTTALGNTLGHTVQCLQSNAEHVLIDRIHKTKQDSTDFIIFNPGAFTHTSIALRDALLAVSIPFIEVHLSNVHAREPFRQHSYFSDIAVGTIVGLGTPGYELALRAVTHYLEKVKGE